MPRFIIVAYGDQDGYDRTAPAVRDAAHAQDDRLRAGGALIGIAGTPVSARNHDAAGTTTSQGPYMQSSLPVAGFSVIEAESLEMAVDLAAQTPCAVAHGVVEVWPLVVPT